MGHVLNNALGRLSNSFNTLEGRPPKKANNNQHWVDDRKEVLDLTEGFEDEDEDDILIEYPFGGFKSTTPERRRQYITVTDGYHNNWRLDTKSGKSEILMSAPAPIFASNYVSSSASFSSSATLPSHLTLPPTQTVTTSSDVSLPESKTQGMVISTVYTSTSVVTTTQTVILTSVQTADVVVANAKKDMTVTSTMYMTLTRTRHVDANTGIPQPKAGLKQGSFLKRKGQKYNEPPSYDMFVAIGQFPPEFDSVLDTADMKEWLNSDQRLVFQKRSSVENEDKSK